MPTSSPDPTSRQSTAAGQSREAPAPAAPTIGAAVSEIVDDAVDAVEHALRFPEGRNSRWRWTGLSRRGERIFDLAGTAVLGLFVLGWAWSITGAADADLADDGMGGRRGLSMPTARIAAALTESDAPSVAYLTEAAIDAVAPSRGMSGKLRAVIRDPGAPLGIGDLPDDAELAFADGETGAGGAGAATRTVRDSTPGAAPARVPATPGVWRMVLAAGQALAPVSDFSVITRRPLSSRRNGRVGLYYIGTWPTERRPREGYRTPSGFVEVTRENQDTWVSEHFRLRDFLTHGQDDVWPKYLVLDMKLVDKLELVLSDLESRGIDVSGIHVMSGFRTPDYNANGGLTAGRASISRHMYGDASDIFIDSDGDGVMDDLDGDGRVTIADAKVVAAAAERVERQHPALVGGVGLYSSGPGHGPFVHIDTRGYRARW